MTDSQAFHDAAVQYVRYIADDKTRVSWPRYLAYVADLADAALMLEKALLEVINLCEIGDVDESTEALGWGEAIKRARAALAAIEQAKKGGRP